MASFEMGYDLYSYGYFYPEKVWGEYIVGQVKSTYRSADTTGAFTPNVYKVTGMRAHRRMISCGKSSWKQKVGTDRYYKMYRAVGDLGVAAFSSIQWPSYDNSSIIQNCVNQALLSAMSKVEQGDLELGVEFGELKETIQMLKSPLNSLRKTLLHRNTLSKLGSIIKHERGRRYLKKSAIESMPDSWLELRYGMMPLFRSIYDILSMVQDGLTKLEPDRIYTARSTKTCSAETTGECPGGNPSLVYWRNEWNVHADVKVRAFVHYKFNEVPTVTDLLGLSPQHLPEILWDLTSLTFVLGWFTNLSSLLGAVRYKPHVTILGNCVGIKTEYNGKNKIGTQPGATPLEADSVLAHGLITGSEYHRVTGVNLSYSPQIDVDINLSWPQIVDLFLLIGQRLPKRGSR